MSNYRAFFYHFVSEVERIVTPETSYENLVAMQCAEIEEAMMNEVQRFYVAWNKKLEELKRRNGQSPSDVNIIGMGVSGGDMRSLWWELCGNYTVSISEAFIDNTYSKATLKKIWHETFDGQSMHRSTELRT